MDSDDDPAAPDYARECLDLVKLAAKVSSVELREELLKIATVYERLALRESKPGERPGVRDDGSALPDEPPSAARRN